MRVSGIVLLASVLMLTGCASSSPSKGTRLQSSWSDSSVSVIPGKKIAVVFRDADPDRRRAVETEMAALIPGALLGVDVLKTQEQLTASAATRSLLQSQGIDYVLVLHFDGFQPEVSYNPATLYRQQADTGFYSYWDNGWKAAYQPETVKASKRTVAQADTRLYDLIHGKLVWSAKSESFNPQNLRSGVREVLKANAEGMRKSGLIN